MTAVYQLGFGTIRKFVLFNEESLKTKLMVVNNTSTNKSHDSK